MPLPLHQSLLFPLIFAKEHLSLALLAPPVTPSLSIPTTFSKAHQPLRPAPRPCLPSKKVRCCHPKKFGRLPEGLLPIRTINEIFRTIPCPAPYPCLPCQRRTSVARKKFGRLPEGLLPIRTINEIFRSIPSTKLASLVKGRWIDGKAQALILLLSVCDTPTFFIYQTFLPSRRRDCFTPTNLSKTALSHPLFVGRASACACTASYPHYPLLSTTSLPPLEKGEVLSPEIIRATTGGIVTPPTFFKTALSLAPHHVLASLVKGEVLSPEKIRATTGGIAPYPHQSLLFPLIFAKEHLSLALLAPPVAPNTANFASIFLIQYTNYS